MGKNTTKADAALAKDVKSLENAKRQSAEEIKATLARIDKNLEDNK